MVPPPQVVPPPPKEVLKAMEMKSEEGMTEVKQEDNKKGSTASSQAGKASSQAGAASTPKSGAAGAASSSWGWTKASGHDVYQSLTQLQKAINDKEWALAKMWLDISDSSWVCAVIPEGEPLAGAPQSKYVCR